MNRHRGRFAALVLFACAALIIICYAAGLWIRFFRERGNELPEDATGMEITFLDVGEGDAILVTADGESMLVDGGLPEYSDLMYTVLKDREMDHLRYVVCTHPHSDHVGGLAGALRYATVDEAFCCTAEYDSRSFGSFLKALENQGVELQIPEAGRQLQLGAAVITVISPSRDYEDLNDDSLVLRIDYGRTSVLLTADAGYQAELDMMDSDYTLRADILKVGHHGSGSSSYYYFLDAVEPQYAVISVGRDNENGHPSEKVLEKLEKLGANVFRTDTDGDITFVSDGKAFTIKEDIPQE